MRASTGGTEGKTNQFTRNFLELRLKKMKNYTGLQLTVLESYRCLLHLVTDPTRRFCKSDFFDFRQ